MGINFLANGFAIQPTSFAMITTSADIFTADGVRQSTPTSATIATTPPTFAGIVSLSVVGGFFQASWAAATAGYGDIVYDVYVQKDTATGLFADANRTVSTLTLSALIVYDANGNQFIPNSTYYVGVRAKDALGNKNTNSVSLSAVYSPNAFLQTSDIPLMVTMVWAALRGSNHLSGSFGEALQGIITPTRAGNLDNLDVPVSTRADQTTVDYIEDDTNYLQAGLTATRMSNLDNLNDQITTRASAASMAAGFAAAAQDATVAKAAALASVSTQVSGVSTQVSGVQTTANTILGQTGTTGVKVATTDQDSIVDKVWDEATSGHTAAGTTGKALIDASAAAAATITPTDLQNIADKVWNEPKASHNTSGTMGEAQNTIASVKTDTTTLTTNYTATRAAKIDNLDVAVSTRESEALASTRAANDLAAHATTQSAVAGVNTGVGNANTSLGALTTSVASVKSDTVAINTKTTNLPSDPAGNASVTAIVAPVLTAANTAASNTVAIKAKTDNLPATPANQASVLAIPTNPLLSTDTRLNTLDANISSRATPSDLAPLATGAQVTNAQVAIQNDIAGVQTTLAGMPDSGDLASAVAPLAQEATSNTILSQIAAVQSGALTAADVWTYGTRGLTESVDANVDVSGLATSAELAAAKADIIAEQKIFEPKLSAVIDQGSDVITVIAWITKNANLLTDATTATIDVRDADDNLIFTMGPGSYTGTHGIFKFTRANASVVLTAGMTYSCHLTINQNSTDYLSVVPLTVF